MNGAGHVIGLAIATATWDESEFGAFTTAVSADIVRRVADEIVEAGRAFKPSIGATLLDDIVQVRAEADAGHQFGGAVIVNVAKNGPAQQAGLKGLDNQNFVRHIITEVNGKSVRGKGDFYHVLLTKTPGDFLQLTVRDLYLENDKGVETMVEVEICSHEDVKYAKSKYDAGAEP